MTTEDENEGTSKDNDRLQSEIGDFLGGESRLSKLARSTSSESAIKREDLSHLLFFRRRTEGQTGISGPLMAWTNPVGDYREGQRLAEAQATREYLEKKPSLDDKENLTLGDLRSYPQEETVMDYIRDSREAKAVAERIRRKDFVVIVPTREPDQETLNFLDIAELLDSSQGVDAVYMARQPEIDRAYLQHPDESKTYLGSYFKIMEKRHMLPIRFRRRIEEGNIDLQEQVVNEGIAYAKELNLRWWASGFMTGIGYAEGMLQHGRGDKAVEAYHVLGILDHKTTLRTLESAAQDRQNRDKISQALQGLGYR